MPAMSSSLYVSEPQGAAICAAEQGAGQPWRGRESAGPVRSHRQLKARARAIWSSLMPIELLSDLAQEFGVGLRFGRVLRVLPLSETARKER